MIEFQYFPGCPHAAETLHNLQQLIEEGVIDAEEVRITKAEDAETAQQMGFQGSPTILVDDIDIYTESKPGQPCFSCRTYIIDGKPTGVLPKEFIRQQLIRLRRTPQRALDR